MKTSFLLLIIPLLAPSLSSHGAVTEVVGRRDVSAQGMAGGTQSPTDQANSGTLGPFDYTATSSASANGVYESSSATQQSSFVWSSGELHVSATGDTHATAGGMAGSSGFQSESQNVSSGSVDFRVDSPTPFTLQATVAQSGGAIVTLYLLDQDDATPNPFVAYFQNNESGSASGTLVPNHRYTFYFNTQNNSGFGPSPIPGAWTSDTSYSATLHVVGTPYALWRQQQLGNSAAADDGDPEGDGLWTLTEYGIGTLPDQPSLPPAVTLHPYAEGERLRILLPRDPAHNDVTVKVRAAPSPEGPWMDLAVSTLGAPFTGPGYVGGDDATPGLKTVEIRDVVNRADAPARFLKVEVSQ